jgi:MoaA/NifB/PqqE/SkfB family radical SAM enzyme
MITTPHDKFCVLPWISLEASPIGTVRPCCLAKNELNDNLGNKFDLNNAKLSDITNSNELTNLRKEFLDGKMPDACQRCWAEEDSGRTSKRMHTLDRLKDILKHEKEWTEEPKHLYFLDLKLGNICNLKCRICGSWSSSTYAGEELKELSKEARKTSFHREMVQKGAWPRKSKTFWNELKEHVGTIRYLEFTGGEPFMIKEHFKFLNTLIDMGVAHNIEIHYNTNGTIYPKEAENIWFHFKHVEIAFSIDATKERFEYQRTEAKWNEVEENIAKFKTLRAHFTNISLQVCSTINIFNVMYLDDVAEWIDKQEFDFVYWNMLHDAPVHSIISLPDEAKKIAYVKLVNSNSTHVDEFKKVADFMMQREGVNHYDLLLDIKRIDQRRGHSLSAHHNELARAIGYE